MLRGWLALSVLISLVCLGCISRSSAVYETAIETPPVDMSDRADCGEILGTAFRSEDERLWFDENCSTWAPETVSAEAAEGGGGRDDEEEDRDEDEDGKNREDCSDIRGTSYRSADERDWYRENCQGGRNNNDDDDDDDGDEENREDCNDIRGTAYRSSEERGWYRENCRADAGGPDREDCDDIRGTNYRSADEREWYRENCMGEDQEEDDEEDEEEEDDD
jgi:hypothetical protein